MASSNNKTGQQRGESSGTALPIRGRKSPDPRPKTSTITDTPFESSHTSDPFLQDFLGPSFDTADFLNSKLPPLSANAAQQGGGGGSGKAIAAESVPLTELSTQSQELVTQLNSHMTRLSDTLTQLTDEILRIGGRLSYQVDLLRADVQGLGETLHEKLREEVKMFVPGGLPPWGATGTTTSPTTTTTATESAKKEGVKDGKEEEDTSASGAAAPSAKRKPGEPECIKQMKMLTEARTRLDSVIKIFGDAMEFTLPPSEVSVSSSFLSVSAPEPGSEQQSSEEKGQQVLKRIRNEITTLLNEGDDPVQGIENAANRIEELKQLNGVWKGTAEEKGRSRFIESLARLVEDRHRELMREMDAQAARDKGSKTGTGTTPTKRAGATREAAQAEDSRSLPGGFGLMSQLQKLRSGL